MKIEQKIEKKSGVLSISLSCENLFLHKKDRKTIRVEESRVREILRNEGYNPGNTIELQILDNRKGCFEATSTFVDLDYVKPAVKVTQETGSRKKRGSRKNNSQKVQKVLDKSVEDVIIEE